MRAISGSLLFGSSCWAVETASHDSMRCNKTARRSAVTHGRKLKVTLDMVCSSWNSCSGEEVKQVQPAGTELGSETLPAHGGDLDGGVLKTSLAFGAGHGAVLGEQQGRRPWHVRSCHGRALPGEVIDVARDRPAGSRPAIGTGRHPERRLAGISGQRGPDGYARRRQGDVITTRRKRSEGVIKVGGADRDYPRNCG